jgi:hypothetical protein
MGSLIFIILFWAAILLGLWAADLPGKLRKRRMEKGEARFYRWKYPTVYH